MNVHFATCRLLQSVQTANERTFARTTWTNQSDNLTAMHLKIDILQNMLISKILIQLRNANNYLFSRSQRLIEGISRATRGERITRLTNIEIHATLLYWSYHTSRERPGDVKYCHQYM